MTIEIMELPYAKNALAPHISAETIDYHYGKHHKGYVEILNALIEGTELEGQSLEEIVKTSTGTIFNNAAQVWNHNFYWSSMRPEGGDPLKGELAEAVGKKFGPLDEFKKAFSSSAADNFGSGWTWLVKNVADSSLAVINTHDAATPLTDAAVIPLLALDVWEHAYYIDYRNARAKYIESFWTLANWDFAGRQYAA